MTTRAISVLCLAPLLAVTSTSAEEELPVSEETQMCLDCHLSATPGIVADWRTSRHAKILPRKAVGKKPLERLVSSEKIPAELSNVVVGCYECHSLNGSKHTDNFGHMGFDINVIVTPNDCATCHATEAKEYAGTKKAQAVLNLEKNPVYSSLVETVIGVQEMGDQGLHHQSASDATKGRTCFACHGTHLDVDGMKKITSRNGDELDVPNILNWPNQGVGRINPDGSLGSCAACHPRHSFSIEIARKPYTCAQCHLEPDVPGWEVYRESMHGTIFLSKGDGWTWDRPAVRVGEDILAPTCATCHNGLLVTPDGDEIVPRTHDFGARLWVRLFGLPYTHPQPKHGGTFEITNDDGLPLPTTFTGKPASEFLIDEPEQERRRAGMIRVCTGCHSTDWAQKHFARMDVNIAESDKMTLEATKILTDAWEKGIANQANPFDEPIEKMWVRQWLFYGNSVRYSAAMGGKDFASFKNGWWYLSENLRKMKHYVESYREKN